MWFVTVFILFVVCVLFWVVCDKFNVDNYYKFRVSISVPYKIVRDINNNYYEITNNLDKVFIRNVKLKEEGVSEIQTIKYKQKFWLLDWMLFDFEEKVWYVNVNEKIEIIY